MPETYGLPEDVPSKQDVFISTAEQAIAGKSVIRRVVLYVLVGLALVSPVPLLGVVPLVLLMATDSGLNG